MLSLSTGARQGFCRGFSGIARKEQNRKPLAVSFGVNRFKNASGSEIRVTFQAYVPTRTLYHNSQNHGMQLRMSMLKSSRTRFFCSTGGKKQSATPTQPAALRSLSMKRTPAEPPAIWKLILKDMRKYVWPSPGPGSFNIKARVVAALTLLVASKLLTIQVPFVFKQLVDSLNEVSDHAKELGDAVGSSVSIEAVAAVPVSFVIMYGLARSGAAFTGELRNAVFAEVAHSAIRRVTRRAFWHLHSLDLEFHLGRQTGKLSRVVDRGGRSINFLLNAAVFRVIPTFLELGLVSGLLATKCGPQYAGVTVATLAAYTSFTIVVTEWRTEIRKRMNRLENEANSKAIDSLINFETVKYFGNEKYETELYDTSLKGFQKASQQTAVSLSFLNFGQNAIFSAGLTAIMYMAANDIVAGGMSVGDIVLVNGLLFQLSIPLNFVGSIYREIRQSMTDMDELYKLQNVKPMVTESENAVPLVVPTTYDRPAIEFKDVKFGYNKDRQILNGLSFKVNHGETVAFVGSSGCGKSTLLRLLYRFYDPSNGDINVYGNDIKSLGISSLRSNIGVVPQDTVLFNDTLGHNIQYGDLSATPERVQEIIKAAQLQKIVKQLPRGLETEVGERGLKLSGGEKQRVAIARAMLKDAPLLLCDEATSALDGHTEVEIMDALKEMGKNRTTVLVAHRLTTIKDVDRIFVLDHGCVIEQGTHKELLNSHGLYAQMWKRQLTTSE